MKPLDEGKKFTEENYGNKASLKAYYNLENVDRQWDNVLRYRSYFDEATVLTDPEGNPYKICLFKRLLRECYLLETALLKDELIFSRLSEKQADFVLLKRKMSALRAVLLFSGRVNISHDTIKRLALREMPSLSPELFMGDSYSRSYDENFLAGEITKETLEEVDRSLLQASPDESVTRTSEPSDLNNTLLAPSASAIPAKLDEIVSFLNDERFPLIAKALCLIYLYHSIRPFEAFYEASSALSAKCLLKNHGLFHAGFLLDFESIAFASSRNFFSQLKITEDSLDLTYFLSYTLPYLQSDEKAFAELLEEARRTVKGEDIKPVRISSAHGEENENVPLTFSAALPVFPAKPEESEVDKIAKKLLEVYPQLKKKEAHFYAGHCTVGLNYTIDMFKREEHTVYETARTSMDDLANRGFYKKTKIQKKFVYTPIPLSAEKKRIAEEKKDEPKAS